ncbi:MAG TPA: ATP-dependent DNA helicase RecG, partial [Propionibacteriaceae bacterium]|nr:ATP-dependent DNA helicase RecG [Propionibacteriaceae bacterium]
MVLTVVPDIPDGGWKTRTFALLNTPVGLVVGSMAKDFEALKVYTVGDLMRHVPRRYLGGTEYSDLSTVKVGEQVALVCRVESLQVKSGNPRGRLEMMLTDGHGRVKATFFGKDSLLKWWAMQLSKSDRGIFVGKIGTFNRELQRAHPAFVMLDEDGRIVGGSDQARKMAGQVSRSGLVGLYPSTSKLVTWTISEAAQLGLTHVRGITDPLPAWVRDEVELIGLDEAFNNVHFPDTIPQAEAGLERLRFDEALTMQLAMAYRRQANRGDPAAACHAVPDGLLDAFDARLPFSLTDGQVEVSDVIFDELGCVHPMQRLLQGEVGSGKTVVALRAMLRAADNGLQSVLLAPTEVLAGQHHASITSLMGDLASGQVLGAPEITTEVVLLTGSMSAAAKRSALAKAANGEAGIIIGTHALLADRVEFANLGLVVVDEQHRFGVEQRAALNAKADLRPHVLAMTATPIPRSVAMTVFGDLEVSTLRELPAGRPDVQTTLVSHARPEWIARAWERVREEVARGNQAFVVCPRINPSDADEFTPEDAQPSATVLDTWSQLSEGPLEGLRVGLLHGRMAADEKGAAMAAFASGQTDVLVATTVIEVGVDVPNATVMVILDADRFGVSQLHQLRGRIGRGTAVGLCLLVTGCDPSSSAGERLAAVARTRDGFELAELDLAQRREGNVLGASQSGSRSSLRLLRVLEHAELIGIARDIAERMVDLDPGCDNPYTDDMVRQI